MTRRPAQKSPLPAILAASTAALALGLFFALRPASPPSDKPEPPATEELTDEAVPTAPPPDSKEETPAPEPSPEETTSEETTEESSDTPAAPIRPSDDELTGPLPIQEEGEEVASLPTLHEPIPFNVPPPPRVDPLPTASQQRTAQANRSGTAPQRVLLRRAVQFPVLINGRPSGSLSVPPRTAVTVRRVYPDGRLEIGYHQSITVVPAVHTDYHQRVRPSAPASRPTQRQISSFPEQTLNPAMGSSSSPAVAPRREIPIQ